MTEKELRDLIKKGESQFAEFKRATIKPSDLAGWLVAFANADGGSVLVGVEDDGSISGIEVDPENVDKILRTSLDYCKPPVELSEQKLPTTEGTVLILDIESSTKVHNTHDGVVYLRIGRENRRLNVDEILRLAYAKGQVSFEKEMVEKAQLDDLDQELLKEFRRRVRTKLSTEELLKARNLIEIGKEGTVLNAACVLLFAQSPQKFMPKCGIDFVRFEGTEMKVGRELNVIKREIIEGPLLRLISDAFEVVEGQIKKRTPLRGLLFEERAEYPEFAWQEAIINAVAHRDYSIRGRGTQIRLFDDRMEVESPGKLPGTVRLDTITKDRFSRNPTIFRVLLDFGYVRDLGEGIDRMIEEMKRYELYPPILAEPNYCFMVALKNTPIYEEETERWLEQLSAFNLSGSQRRALAFILNYGAITNFQYREINRVDRDKAIKDLQMLINLKLVRMMGKKRGARYILEERWKEIPKGVFLDIVEEYVRKHGSVSNKEYRKLKGVSRLTALSELKELVKEGRLKMIGKGRGARYVKPGANETKVLK